MRAPADHRTVRLSIRVYRRLLLAYPTAHREAFGADMAQVFRDQCRAAWRRHGGIGVTLLWGATLADLFISATREHFTNLQTKIIMLQKLAKLFRLCAPSGPVFWVTFLYIFVTCVFTGTVTTLIMPKTYSSTARIILNRGDGKTAEYNPYLIQEVMQRLRAAEVFDQVITELDLTRVFGARYNFESAMAPAASRVILGSKFEFRPVRGASLIDVRAYSEQPQEAAQLANGLVAAFLRQVEKARQDPSARAATSTAFNETKFNVVNYAEANSRPARPNVPVNVVIAIIIGTAVGTILGGVVAGLVRWLLQRPHRRVTHP